jgi:hypothetical protein
MIKRKYRVFVLLAVCASLAGSSNSLRAQTIPAGEAVSAEKNCAADKSSPEPNPDIQKASAGSVPANSAQNSPEVKNETDMEIRKEPELIRADEIFDHPEVILQAYQEAYPNLVTGVIRGENDWIIKFANGNQYYWAGGRLLPQSALKKADKYLSYSIDPCNLNGRFPELYSREMITLLRTKQRPSDKIKAGLREEGSLYKELFGITSEKSAESQLVVVKFCGRYIAVHNIIADKLKTVDAKVNQLAKTDPEVRAFLNNISSVQTYNWRKIAWISRMSNHSYGIAVDILAKRYNRKPTYWMWEEERNKDWMLLPQSRLWTPPDAVVKIFLEEKFIWGGYWDRYDTMHFEYRPELIALFKRIRFDQKPDKDISAKAAETAAVKKQLASPPASERGCFPQREMAE